MDMIAQVISIAAMTINILSYQQKKGKGILIMIMCGSALFSVSFFMMGAYIGGILNAVAAIRSILFLKKDVLKTDRLFWLPIFFAVYVLAYVATFTVFHKEPSTINFIIEALPVIGMVAHTLAFRIENAAHIRRFSLVSSVAWLIYNFTAGSIGAICCEIFSMISIFIAMYRYDRKKQEVSRG